MGVRISQAKGQFREGKWAARCEVSLPGADQDALWDAESGVSREPYIK